MIVFSDLIPMFWRNVLRLSSGWWNYVQLDTGHEAGHYLITLVRLRVPPNSWHQPIMLHSVKPRCLSSKQKFMSHKIQMACSVMLSSAKVLLFYVAVFSVLQLYCNGTVTDINFCKSWIINTDVMKWQVLRQIYECNFNCLNCMIKVLKSLN